VPGGNPAAVVLDATQTEALAAEFNYDESTFVLPAEARALRGGYGSAEYDPDAYRVRDGAKIRAHIADDAPSCSRGRSTSAKTAVPLADL